MCFHLADRRSAPVAETRADAPLSSKPQGQTAGSWPLSGGRDWVPSVFFQHLLIRGINENDLRGDTGKFLPYELLIPFQKIITFYCYYYSYCCCYYYYYTNLYFHLLVPSQHARYFCSPTTFPLLPI